MYKKESLKSLIPKRKFKKNDKVKWELCDTTGYFKRYVSPFLAEIDVIEGKETITYTVQVSSLIKI
jgi:hypothetical protein